MKKWVFLAILLPAFSISVFSQTDVNKPVQTEGTKPVGISGQWFLANQTKYEGNQLTDNLFTLKRGYVTFKKDFNSTFSVRYTQDITLDKEGSDAGNVEMRLKYLYLKINMQDLSIFQNSYVEIGMIHRPWLDFEQHVNDYRVQGKMFLERSNLLNSADFGLNFVTLLGGKIDESYRTNVSSSYPGKYGSFSLAVLNGGGYHAIELSNNKNIEARLSLRPFPSVVPGFQFSLHGIYGKGNSQFNPDFALKHLCVSYESERAIIIAQAFQAVGNSYGSFLDINNESYETTGASLFGELYLVKKKFSILGSYNSYKLLENQDEYDKRIIGGVCYHFLNKQKLLFDVDHLVSQTGNKTVMEIALELRF
jgi:hypothetical protein